MMGHINSMMVKMVLRDHGDAGVDRLFELAGLPRQEYYPEVVYRDQFPALYRAVCELYGLEDEEAQKAFAAYFCEVSPRLFPAIYEEAGSARGLFLRVPLIHKQWASAASQADFREKLWVIDSDESRLVYKYDSPNRLCGVLRWVARGVFDHYDERGQVNEPQCVRSGAEHCVVEILFEST